MSRRRAGAPARARRVDGPTGPFVLAPGLAAPGALPLADAVGLVAAEVDRRARERLMDPETARGAGICARAFAGYAAAACGVTALAEVDRDTCELYIHSPHSRGGADGRPGKASVGTKASRRTYLRMMFKVCRALGLDDRDPTADIVLPPRQPAWRRPLTDPEVLRCKDASFRSETETRLPCALALALSGASTAEGPRMTVDDVWPEHRRAWAHGGGVRSLPRWLELDGWAVTQVTRRLEWLDANPPNPQQVTEGPRGLTYHPRKLKDERRKSQQNVSDAILQVLRLAGLGDEPGVRPMSLQEWFAKKVYDETGSVEHVAARMGMVSLDAAADMAGLDWRGLYDLDGPPGVHRAPDERGR